MTEFAARWAATIQSGQGNIFGTAQIGSGLKSTTNQKGDGNASGTNQVGLGHKADTHQRGTGNVSVRIQNTR